jgi:hypothetical protein
MGTDQYEPDHSDAEYDEFITSITPDVMGCLSERRFFEELDNRLCPTEASSAREYGGGTYKISTSILESLGFNEADIAEIFSVLQAQRGCCDCEILYNVAEISRLRTQYWQAKAEGKEPQPFHKPNR